MFPNAFFHTQDLGNRGVDVLAIQHLLHLSGPDGIFGATTRSAVVAFQRSKGLAADGIAGPLTWGALTPLLREGASGPAVRALQAQLNAKRRLALAVDGQFTAEVGQAVRAFQMHAGIGADAVAGPVTWRNLVWHYAYPSFAGMCDKDPDGNGPANWGTGAAVGQVEAAVRMFATGTVPLGDVGFEHGGPIPGHASHQAGLDVDLWPIRSDDAQCTAERITWRSADYDREATRRLAQAVRATAPGHVKYIWFNDPVLIQEGLTDHWPNHDNHLHVRYCEAGHPSAAYLCGAAHA
ncbi:penicillin-insensitive murein endopeptidase [Nonomuraea typhae]|uniref:Penicillin-insensitive murein endopeptidase n=1 Tax=Nonomuraea typhae TaxID=2603600 RepID=A0ABW7YQG2_9ACTN